MLTERQVKLYNYLVDNDDGTYIGSSEIAFELGYYKADIAWSPGAARKNAMSSVQADVAKLVEEYAMGNLEYLVVGINTKGYKIGTQKQVSAYITRRWKHIVRGIKLVKAIAEKAGLDGQLTFTEDGIEEMITVRREND